MSSAIRYVPPDRWRLILLIAAIMGAVSAGLDVPLRWGAQQVGWTTAAGSRVSAGSIIPIALVAQFFYPHRGVATLALLAALAAYVPVTLVIHGVVIADFPLPQLAKDLAFVALVDLAIGLILIASLQKVFAARVGIGYDPITQCTGCGYSLQGLTEPRCPECGRGFRPRVAGTVQAHNNDAHSVTKERSVSP